jgi:hypothetical protein
MVARIDIVFGLGMALHELERFKNYGFTELLYQVDMLKWESSIVL